MEFRSMLHGAFLALFCGLSREGTARSHETLMDLPGDPHAYPEEAKFFRHLVAELAPYVPANDKTEHAEDPQIELTVH
jgi:hypothetical protein